jgi:hypothetical protein
LLIKIKIKLKINARQLYIGFCPMGQKLQLFGFNIIYSNG